VKLDQLHKFEGAFFLLAEKKDIVEQEHLPRAPRSAKIGDGLEAAKLRTLATAPLFISLQPEMWTRASNAATNRRT
jgi:hypothetical protein